LGLPLEEFVARHCYRVAYQGHEIHVLFGACSFFDTEFRCTLEKHECKPLQCLLYPAMIGYPGDKRRIFIDEQDCPMASRVGAQFRDKAFAVCEELAPQLPDWWLEFNLEHCWPLYDFEKLAALDHRKVVSVEDLKRCELPANESEAF